MIGRIPAGTYRGGILRIHLTVANPQCLRLLVAAGTIFRVVDVIAHFGSVLDRIDQYSEVASQGPTVAIMGISECPFHGGFTFCFVTHTMHPLLLCGNCRGAWRVSCRERNCPDAMRADGRRRSRRHSSPGKILPALRGNIASRESRAPPS